MNYSTVDFIEVRRLVLQHELEPGLQERLDDSALFRASNEVYRAKLAICNLRERATVINQRLSLAPHLGEHQLRHFDEEGSIWFDEAIFSELLCMIPIAVARCPDLLHPEILVHAVLTTKYAGPLLKACLMYIPLLRKQCIDLLADFIFKWTRIGHVGTCYRPPDPLLFYCFQQSYSAMESFCQSDFQIARILREALVRRCICASMIIHITVEVLKDGVDFITRILFSDEEICRWIVSCIRSRKRSVEIGFSSSDVEILPKTFPEPVISIHCADASQLKEATVLQLCNALHVDAEAAFHEYGWTSRLYCHLKLYCVLVHLGELQPIHEEVIFWLRALTCMVDPSGGNVKGPASKNLISKRRFELGVAFLFLVPGFRGSSSMENLFRECVLFFLGPAISGLVPFEQGSEIALWLVVQLLLQCCTRVSEYCSKAIGMNIKIASTCWEDVCRLAHETGITSDTKSITKAASSLRPTGPICNTKCDQLVLECLLQLLKSGHFVHCGIDITESIMHCILLSVEPIHPILVQTIEMYAEASCNLTSENSSDANEMHSLPFSFLASAIKPFFSCFMLLESTPGEETGGMSSLCDSTGGRNHPSNFIKTESATVAVLASFYILCREQFQRSQGTFLGNCNYILTCTNNEEISWSKLLRSLPLDRLLTHMEAHRRSYEHIFTRWVGLAISLFPEHLHVSHLVQRLEVSGDSVAKQERLHQFEEQVGINDEDVQSVLQSNGNEGGANLFCGNFPIKSARQVFRNSSVNSVPALKLLKAIRLLNISSTDKLELQIAVIEDVLPLLLDKSCSESLQEALCEWWYSLDRASVEFLTPLFCRCIMISDMDIDERSLSTINNVGLLSASNLYQELVEQPLSILTCRMEIYHTTLISILLDILKDLLVRNRRMCLLALSNDGEVKKEETLRALDTRDRSIFGLGIFLGTTYRTEIPSSCMCAVYTCHWLTVLKVFSNGTSNFTFTAEENFISSFGSAVCQILLENWSKMSSLGITTDSVLKAGSLICAFISSLFYSSPSIFRVVHFQGYDMKLIPAVAKGVTLMIHFLEFFEDSLNFVELSMLPFTVVLLSSIIRRHPSHSRSLTAARKAVMHIRCIDLEATINLLGEILEPMAWFAVTFPLLEPEVREFLEGCLRAIDSGKLSAAVNMKGFRSSALSALELLNKDGRWHLKLARP